METLSASQALCEGNLLVTGEFPAQRPVTQRSLALCEGHSPITGEFPSERPVTRSFDVFFDLRLNKRLRKPSRRRRFETHRSHYDITVMCGAILNHSLYVKNKYTSCKWYPAEGSNEYV